MTVATTKKAAKKPAAKKTAAKKTAARKPAAKKAAAAPAVVKPVKETLTKSGLAASIAESSGVELKAVKAVLGSLESTIMGSVHKRGVGEFTLPGLLKLSVQKVPAKKKRFGKDPFSGEERWFAAKPASVRIKARAMKKLKDAAM
ncbi:MAG: HU family DNA-binding protein [Burkholderiaceae bacterium]